MLRLAGERERIAVVDDQHGAPTSAELIADITAHALRAVMGKSAPAGTYHLAATGVTTWNAYARLVVDAARRARPTLLATAETIEPCLTADFPTPARRPHNSRLATEKLRDTFEVTLPPWQEGVVRAVTELCDK
jgi:dTDP-4-dehydrorhamnose reductase